MTGIFLFALTYWQTKVFEIKRISTFVATEESIISHAPLDEIIRTVGARFANENHLMTYSAVFDPTGQPIVGNLRHVPASLLPDGHVHEVELRDGDADGEPSTIIAAATRLPDGKLLVMGRGEHVVSALQAIFASALLLGVIPTIGPALAAGIWLSRKAQRRVKAVNQSIERILQGNVHERLPVHRMADDFDQLAASVNRILAEIERLLAEVQGVSDSIAHDLRTPLARVRTFLERGREKAQTREELAAVTDRAIAGLDQAQSIITALLRIGEIEGGQRRAAFAEVDLNDIVREAAELYEPGAEEKQIQLNVEAAATSTVIGDRDLLVEAVANLLDNAIKFTPPGGRVDLSVTNRKEGPVIRVADTGPGIPPEERAAVMKRFYRIDKSRHVVGSGLGLSIVLAIVRLHNYEIVVGDAEPGCCFELLCYQTEMRSEAESVLAPTSQKLRVRTATQTEFPTNLTGSIDAWPGGQSASIGTGT